MTTESHKARVIMPLSTNLKRLRGDKGLTQGQLAEASGVSMPQISKIERGESENPELGTIKKLCIALSTTSDELIFDESERNPNNELKLLFEAASKLPDGKQVTIKEVISALIMKSDAEQWIN